MSLVESTNMYPNRQKIKVCLPENSMPGIGGGAELISLIRPEVSHFGHEQRGSWRMESRKLLDYLIVYIASGHGRFEVTGVATDASP